MVCVRDETMFANVAKESCWGTCVAIAPVVKVLRKGLPGEREKKVNE